ncbi:MAG: class A beta-lactamase-related serine hydrolase [Bacteroidetes bacterium]|nr:MAG: class A beta-lactamase-related serine hydrolase [Bacteroidota bacterium]
MYKTIYLCLILAILPGCTQQENKLPTAKPEKVGMSSERINRIKPVMQRYIDENKLPGMLTMVARHGKVIHFEKYGLMDVDKPMQFNTIFRIASMTKPVTSVAVMMLYEEGHFQLDDPVADYIPEFKNLKVFSSIDKDGIHTLDPIRPMTIRDLLTHTSGLSGVGADTPVDSIYSTANLSEGTLKDMIQKLSKIPLLYQPGTRWNYSRSTDVLGYLVEVISGKPLDVFLKERIFIPLKMKDTDFYVTIDKIERVAAVYAPADSIGIKVIMKPDTNNISIPVKFLSGNGGLVSTATDYMIFSQMLLNKGKYNGVRLLGSNTVDLMTSNHISNEIMPDDDFFGQLLSGMGFGFGFAVLQDNIQSNIIGSKGSYWWSGSANTYFYIDPKEELILILMTQFVPNFYYPVCKEFRELVYQTIVD